MKRLFHILLNFYFISYSFGQNISIVNESTVYFQDKDGVQIAVLNLTSLNPFDNLTYSKIVNTNSGEHRAKYDLGGVSLKSVLASSIDTGNLSDSLLAINLKTASSSYSSFIGENDFVVAYELGYSADGVEAIYAEGEIFVFDNKGKQKAHLSQIEYGCYSPRITLDGRYIAILQGDVSAHTNESLYQGVKLIIFDLENGNRIYEFSDPSVSLYEPVIVENLIIEVVRLQSSLYEYLVFDPYSRSLFRRRFTREEVGRIRSFSTSGFILEINSKETLIPFSQFEITSF